MKVFIVTSNGRISKSCKEILSLEYGCEIEKDIDVVLSKITKMDYIIYHSEEELESLLASVDTITKKCEKHHLFILRSVPTFAEGETLLKYDIGGYGNVNMQSQPLLQAIQVMINGNVWLYPSMMEHIIQKVNHINANEEIPEQFACLTKREVEVAMLVAKGESNNMIANDLEISQNTVKLHISSIFEKLGIKSRVALALQASHH